MYGLSAGRGNGPQERARERREEIAEQRRRAREQYPDLPGPEARRAYEQFAEGKRGAEELWREYWPILLAVAGGLVIFTFMKR